MFNLHLVDLDDTLCTTTEDLQGARGRLGSLRLYPDARGYLTTIKTPRVLVSVGDFDYQYAKIKHLGIEDLFLEIHICESPEAKEVAFTSVVSRLGISPEETLVLGDRVDREIRFGNAMGATTVRIRRPKCKYFDQIPSEVVELPHHEVRSFTQIAWLLRK